MIALTEAWQIIVEVDWSSHHFSQNCQIVWVCVSVVTGAFSHINCISIYTFSHEKLYSAHTEVSRPVALVSMLVPGRQCPMKIFPGSPKITYVRTTLRIRTRQITHQSFLLLTKCCTFWDSLVWFGVEYCHQDLSRLLL